MSSARNRKPAERQFAALSLVLGSGNKEKIILKVVFDKETILKLNLDRIDPVHAIENFDFNFWTKPPLLS